jgi:hypothetical protein
MIGNNNFNGLPGKIRPWSAKSGFTTKNVLFGTGSGRNSQRGLDMDPHTGTVYSKQRQWSAEKGSFWYFFIFLQKKGIFFWTFICFLYINWLIITFVLRISLKIWTFIILGRSWNFSIGQISRDSFVFHEFLFTKSEIYNKRYYIHKIKNNKILLWNIKIVPKNLKIIPQKKTSPKPRKRRQDKKSSIRNKISNNMYPKVTYIFTENFADHNKFRFSSLNLKFF